MKKITKILVILVSMTLVCNLQAFSVFGEEIQPDPVTEMETEAGEKADVDVEKAPVADMDAVSVTEEELPEEAETENELCAGSYTPEGASYSLEYDVLEDGTIKITGCSGKKSGNLIIPDEIDGKAVTEIGNNAFEYCSGFTGNLTIPDSVETVGECAFFYCNGFNGNLTIGNSVKAIRYGAFAYCSSLTGNLIIPDSVETIGEDTLSDMGGYTFCKCLGLTGTLTIPDGVTAIGDYEFYSCEGLTGTLTIPDGVEIIGNNAFADCDGFTGTLTIPDSVTTIGDNAFRFCRGFNGNLIIGDSVETIGKGAFLYNGFTGTLTIPDSVTTIGEYAFEGCSGFSGSLTIPDSVTTIGEYTFSGCSGFRGSLTIPDSVTKIGDYAFEKCSGFSESLTIPDSVTTIGNSSFNGCRGFRRVINHSNQACTLPDSAGLTWKDTAGQDITSIANGIATRSDYWGENLYEPYPDAGYELRYDELDDGTIRITGWKGTPRGNLVIPDKIEGKDVTTIGDQAFENCSGFTGSLIIPDSIKTIGMSAFTNCTGFTGLTISAHNVQIEADAFLQCNNLRIITSYTDLPNLVGIGEWYDFDGNVILFHKYRKYTVAYRSNVETLERLPYENATYKLRYVKLDDRVIIRGYTGTPTGNLSIPDKIDGIPVTTIGDHAFEDCRDFTGSLTIPDSVTMIGNHAFDACWGFTGSLTIGDSVEVIGEKAFVYCHGFTDSLMIPDSVTMIDSDVFTGCYFPGIKNNSSAECILPAPWGEIWVNELTGEEITSITNGCAVRGYSLSVRNGSDVSAKVKEYYRAGDSITVAADEPAEGKRFKEWTGKAGLVFTEGSANTSTATFTMPADRVTVTATYEDASSQQYTITFDPNGGSVDTVTGTTGTDGKLASFPTPTRLHYDFSGWFTASFGGKSVTEDTVFSGNDTIHAHWAEQDWSADLSDAEVTLGPALTYTGKEQTQTLGSVKIGDLNVPSDDYVITHNTGTNAGTYTLTITAKEDSAHYRGSKDVEFTIAKRAITPFVTMHNSTATYTFSGKKIIPTISLQAGITFLKVTDYTCAVTDNVNVGTGKITMSETEGGNYTFTPVSRFFTIEQARWNGQDDDVITETSRSYILGCEVSDGFDLMDYLPDNCGTITYDDPVSSNDNFSYATGKKPKVAGNILSYTIDESNEIETDTITVTARTQNYSNAFVVKVKVRRQAMGLFEKISKTNKPLRISKALTVGKTFTLLPGFYDENITNTKVVWSSSNPDVATVNQDGKVTAMSAGTAVIKAVSEYNAEAVFSQCKVTVAEPVTAVTLDKKNYSFGADADVQETTMLSAQLIPFEAAQEIRWSTSNNAVVIVCDENGDELTGGSETGSGKIKGMVYDVSSAQKIKIKAVGQGTAKVTAEAVDGSGKKAVCSFTVGNPVPDFTVSGKGNKAEVEAGKTLNMQVGWPDAKKKPKNTGVIWSLEGDPVEIASISSTGVVTGITAGTVTVKATSAANPAKVASTEITVTAPEIKGAKVTGISFTAKEKALKTNGLAVGKSYTIKPTLVKEGKGSVAANAVAWYSSDDSVATVTQKGAVKAVGKGTVTITAVKRDDGAIKASVTFTVKSPVKSIKVDKTKLTIGTQDGAKYGSVRVATLAPLDVTDPSIEWKTNNELVKIAAVDAGEAPTIGEFAFAKGSGLSGTKNATGTGVVTGEGQYLAIMAVKPGVVKLTGITKDGSNKKMTVTVTVRGEVTGLSLKTTTTRNGLGQVEADNENGGYKSTLKPGGSVTITPLLDINEISATTNNSTEKKAYADYKKYTDVSVSYRSSNANVVTVDKKGKISVKRGIVIPENPVTVYAVGADGKLKVQISIKVAP